MRRGVKYASQTFLMCYKRFITDHLIDITAVFKGCIYSSLYMLYYPTALALMRAWNAHAYSVNLLRHSVQTNTCVCYLSVFCRFIKSWWRGVRETAGWSSEDTQTSAGSVTRWEDIVHLSSYILVKQPIHTWWWNDVPWGARRGLRG